MSISAVLMPHNWGLGGRGWGEGGVGGGVKGQDRQMIVAKLIYKKGQKGTASSVYNGIMGIVPYCGSGFRIRILSDLELYTAATNFTDPDKTFLTNKSV
jgi:hypothetical protein